MDASMIIGFIILIVIIVLVFKFIKKFIAAFFIANLIILLTVGGLGFLVYKDVMDIKENMATASNLFFLEDNKELLTGLKIGNLESEQEFEVLDAETISQKKAGYKEKDYDKVLGDSYKMIVVKLDGFKNVGKIELGDNKIDEETAFQMLKSDDPLGVMVEMLTADRDFNELESTDEFKTLMEEELATEFGEAQEVKSHISILLFMSAFEKKGPLFLIKEYKRGNVIIYPETITFKVVKSIPMALFNKVADKVMKGEN